MTAIIAIISALDLGNQVESQFAATLDRAELLKVVASNMVRDTLNRDLVHPWRQSLLHDGTLQKDLTDIMSTTTAVMEIAVCDMQGEILLDSVPSPPKARYPGHPEFKSVVDTTNWLDKVRMLNETKYYQLEQPLGAGGKAELYVRVIIYPPLMKKGILPTLRKSANVALVSVAGAICITLLFSVIAFRPLGRLGHLLDMVAQGDDLKEALPVSRAAADEFGVMASKVSLLGQQLRGAQFDFTDLRGNFERLLDQLEDAVLIFGRDRRLVVAAGAVENFLGRTRAELIGCALTEVFPPGTTLGLILAQSAQTGRPIRNRRVPINRSNGSGAFVALLSVDILESLAAGANTGRGTALLVRLRDPEAQRQIGRQLQTADRLSAISRITGGVAHEVKNPLNAMLMHVELARMKLSSGDTDVAPQMEIISREILRLDRVVKTFLDFTRPVELNLSDVPLDAFVREIVELASPQAAAAGIRVAVKQDIEATSIRVDVDLMKQAILNIVVNAFEAMPDGGELRIECAMYNDEAEIRISDTGTGIPPELREKIFRLYYTTKPEGSGIGLAMTFRLVQLHDGAIDFASEPGNGTTFVLRLPISA